MRRCALQLPKSLSIQFKSIFTVIHTTLKAFIYDVIRALSKNKRPYYGFSIILYILLYKERKKERSN